MTSVRNVLNVPVWTATAEPAPPIGKLEGDMVADVAIVGAGYTGLSAAIELAKAGRSVVVVDAAPLGAGASGRNGGQINPGLKLDPDDAVQAIGPAAEDALSFAGRAPDVVFDLVERYGIKCNIRRCGWLMPAHRASAVPILDRRANSWRRRGVDVRTLTREETRRLVGSDSFVSGIIDPRGGNLQPLSYVRGLARAAISEGAQIFVETPVTSLNSDGKVSVIKTGGGVIRAGQVILATNGYTDALWPRLKATIVPVHSFQIATVPLPASVGASIFPEGHHAADTRHLIQYFRKDPDGRVLIGGQGRTGGPRSASDFNHLLQSLVVMFPGLADIEIDFAWSGVVAVTPDYFPHVHRLAPGVTAALGYNGRGVAMATALGQSVGKHVIDPTSRLGIPVTSMKPIPFHRLHEVYAAIASSYFRLRDGG